ncbi:MAG: 4Fe-4S ferredoxin iron-sulfur binding protein [uncultured bacterium]|nr:MAG: 4Fe-4S ferredoxin iron-sulfur binding protein [uncultured bacterium]
MKKKLGIYICACGGNISDYVDIEKVKESIKDEECVILAKTTMFACGDSNQKDMDADIKANDLSGIVVASCSPKLHLTTFRAVSERAGLNKYNYVHANIREQASWAHSDNKAGATEKAILLVKAAIAKARLAEPLMPFKIKSRRSVAVIGAGVAGLKAAIALSRMNDEVFLVERESRVGGKLHELDTISPEHVSGKELLSRLEEDLIKEKNITLFTNSEVVGNSGTIGDFTLTIKISGSQGETTKDIKVGSVLVATGFNSYTPTDGEFGYNHITNVITLPQFRELLRNNSKKLVCNGKEINSVAYIYCVGSRQVKGENKYCSRYCCTAAVQASLDVKAKYPEIQNYHFTKGVRTYGKQELVYKESNKQGDIYIQFLDKKPPVVTESDGIISIKAGDLLSEKKEIEAIADLVVLVTGMVPDKDTSVGSLFKLPKGRDKFFNEIHMKLRPVETVIDGITIAGTCQGPKNVMESVNSALAAAVKSHSFVSKGELELEPIVAYVNTASCNWCTACSDACPFSAISMVDSEGKQVASINKSTCKGCGMCLPVCPSDSIELISYSNKEMESMIDVLAQ